MIGRPTLIVATEPVPEAARVAFARFGGIAVVENGSWAPLERAEVLIVRTSSVSAGLLSGMPCLKAIARTGVGLDNIDLGAVTRRRIPLLRAPDVAARPVAEGTLALLLAAAKRLPELSSVVHDGRWTDRYGYEVADLHGGVLGVVGLGRVGSEVAALGRALGMRVVACDPRYSIPNPAPPVAALMELDQLFECADAVTLHCPLTEDTRGMIGRELLARGKPGKVLVNASRGGLVDEAALIEALNEGWVSAVGLDVFPTEPPSPESPLLRHPRVVCTPHAVGLSRSWNLEVFTSLADDVERVLNGVAPIHIANPSVLNASANGSARFD
jgi:phosphoglycerate dehydrogenase-like enzyme